MTPTGRWSLVALSVPLVLGASQPPAGSTSTTIDAAVWAPASTAVTKDDIVGLGRIYHRAAVLVSMSGTKPIAQAIAGWGKDMVTAKRAGTTATVTFRFAKRQDDAESAFESGIFKYTTTTRAGVASPSYRRFEALLVKQGGKWLITMERQLEATSEAEWNALPH